MSNFDIVYKYEFAQIFEYRNAQKFMTKIKSLEFTLLLSYITKHFTSYKYEHGKWNINIKIFVNIKNVKMLLITTGGKKSNEQNKTYLLCSV